LFACARDWERVRDAINRRTEKFKHSKIEGKIKAIFMWLNVLNDQIEDLKKRLAAIEKQLKTKNSVT